MHLQKNLGQNVLGLFKSRVKNHNKIGNTLELQGLQILVDGTVDTMCPCMAFPPSFRGCKAVESLLANANNVRVAIARSKRVGKKKTKQPSASALLLEKTQAMDHGERNHEESVRQQLSSYRNCLQHHKVLASLPKRYVLRLTHP